jgi:hypothetical protein
VNYTSADNSSSAFVGGGSQTVVPGYSTGESALAKAAGDALPQSYASLSNNSVSAPSPSGAYDAGSTINVAQGNSGTGAVNYANVDNGGSAFVGGSSQTQGYSTSAGTTGESAIARAANDALPQSYSSMSSGGANSPAPSGSGSEYGSTYVAQSSGSSSYLPDNSSASIVLPSGGNYSGDSVVNRNQEVGVPTQVASADAGYVVNQSSGTQVEIPQNFTTPSSDYVQQPGSGQTFVADNSGWASSQVAQGEVNRTSAPSENYSENAYRSSVEPNRIADAAPSHGGSFAQESHVQHGMSEQSQAYSQQANANVESQHGHAGATWLPESGNAPTSFDKPMEIASADIHANDYQTGVSTTPASGAGVFYDNRNPGVSQQSGNLASNTGNTSGAKSLRDVLPAMGGLALGKMGQNKPAQQPPTANKEQPQQQAKASGTSANVNNIDPRRNKGKGKSDDDLRKEQERLLREHRLPGMDDENPIA